MSCWHEKNVDTCMPNNEVTRRGRTLFSVHLAPPSLAYHHQISTSGVTVSFSTLQAPSCRRILLSTTRNYSPLLSNKSLTNIQIHRVTSTSKVSSPKRAIDERSTVDQGTLVDHISNVSFWLCGKLRVLLPFSSVYLLSFRTQREVGRS